MLLKNNTLKKKILLGTAILSLMTIVPGSNSKVFADTNISDSVIVIDIDQFEWDWEYEPNFRTMQILDVATFVNEHQLIESNADYRPENAELDIKNLSATSEADIKEYLGFKETTLNREPVTTVDGDGAYASKLRYLIDNNIVSRDVVYTIDKEGSRIYKDADSFTDQDLRSEAYKDRPVVDKTTLQYVEDGRIVEAGNNRKNATNNTIDNADNKQQ